MEKRRAMSLQEAFAQAQQKLESGQLESADLERLYELARPRQQRLLYLYAQTPTVRAPVLAATLQDCQGPLSQIDPLAPEIPYNSVLAAMGDGWRVIHFPDHRAAYEPGRIDMLGYEFILEKYGA